MPQNQDKKKTEKKRRAHRDSFLTRSAKAKRLAGEARKAAKKIRQLQRRAAQGKPLKGTLQKRVRRLRGHGQFCATKARDSGYKGSLPF